MDIMRMILFHDGTTIGAFHKPLGKSIESFSLRGSSVKSAPTVVNCLILEPNGNCFTLIDAAALATGKLQRFTSASCPSVYVSMLGEVLRFRNMYFHQNIYAHQHHLTKEQLKWRNAALPTQIRWRCGGFKAASIKIDTGMYLFQSMDGIAQVTLCDTGSMFEATFLVPVAMHNDTTRFPVTLMKQRFYRDLIPESWLYPATVLIQLRMAYIIRGYTMKMSLNNDTENKPSPELIQEAKYYLEQWQKHTKNPELKGDDGQPLWRFKKAKQVWILRWMYRADVVNKALFSIVLEYLGGMQGTARDRVLREAQVVIEATKDSENQTTEAEQTLEQKLQRRKMKRAFQIAKALA
ncbi:hypothetical protein THRCLA_00069 [Thraustotheca clavata]|uniref:WKF domain-containing protein n=1 Tax=Thraustotheca clavata TaxID=74557 RepID=A0A1W0ACD5_9STRA|nr:hypothetical protein THRCLA_00069 [Thraustotheca clavata]